MIQFFKKLFVKAKPHQVFPPMDLEKLKNGLTIAELSHKIFELEKRIIETEKYCNLRSDEERIADSKLEFNKEIKRFGELEQKFLILEIDRKILTELPNLVKHTKQLPWNNEKNGFDNGRNAGFWMFRLYYLQYTKEKLFKMRRESFQILTTEDNQQ